jgi:hypothetical protein
MAQRDVDAIQAELNRLADHMEVMVSIRVEIDRSLHVTDAGLLAMRRTNSAIPYFLCR